MTVDGLEDRVIALQEINEQLKELIHEKDIRIAQLKEHIQYQVLLMQELKDALSYAKQ